MDESNFVNGGKAVESDWLAVLGRTLTLVVLQENASEVGEEI